MGQNVKNILYTADGENGPSCSLCQKGILGDLRMSPGVLESEIQSIWSLSKFNWKRDSGSLWRGSSRLISVCHCSTVPPGSLAATLCWMFKSKVPSTHRATDATQTSWITLITQWAWIRNPNCPGILEVIINWPKGKSVRLSSEEEEENVSCAEEAPPHNPLPENEKQYLLFNDGSCHIVGIHWKWKAAAWSSMWPVAEAIEG